jgi:hypothetical protein
MSIDIDRYEKDMRGYEDKFKESADKSEKMYNQVEPVVSQAAIYMKTTFDKRLIPSTSPLRDLSEGVKALSSLRSDTLNATKLALEARTKIEDMRLKVEKSKSEENDNVDSTAIIHQFVAKMREGSISTSPTNNHQDFGEDELEKRFNNEIGSSISLSKNDRSMKYDFNTTISYAFDEKENKTVALDKDGKKLKDYSDERIPEDVRFKKMQDGTPINTRNKPIPIYKGE